MFEKLYNKKNSRQWSIPDEKCKSRFFEDSTDNCIIEPRKCRSED